MSSIREELEVLHETLVKAQQTAITFMNGGKNQESRDHAKTLYLGLTGLIRSNLDVRRKLAQPRRHSGNKLPIGAPVF